MHQDTLTFSEVLDIDTRDLLTAELELATHGTIEYRCRINGHLVLDSTTLWQFDLLSPIHVHVLITHVSAESALEVRRLNINGLEVLPRYQHLASPPRVWLNQSGVWDLHIASPFYGWYHEISGQGWVA